MEYYGETEAEHARLDIMPAWFFIREMNLNFPTHIETPTLIELVKGKDVFQPLVVPMSFYRERVPGYALFHSELFVDVAGVRSNISRNKIRVLAVIKI